MEKDTMHLQSVPTNTLCKKTLTIQNKLGEGNFGKIQRATVLGFLNNGEPQTVAVKRLKSSSNIIERNQLMKEIKIMIQLGQHKNVVEFLGTATPNGNGTEISPSVDTIIMEYCQYGDLRSYLLQNRCHFIDQINPETDEIVPQINLTRAEIQFLETIAHSNASNYINDHLKSDNYKHSSDSNYSAFQMNSDLPVAHDLEHPLTTSTLVSWSRQIASAMAHINSKRIVHCDLAARNVLLTDNNIVKICDFGLAIELPESNACAIDEDTTLPWKWSALECLRDQVCSSQSDIWSFGVCLWELFSLGQLPYADIEENTALLDALNMGWRMEKPIYSTEALYNIMMECWNENAEDRPEFVHLEKWFAKIVEQKGVL